MHSSTASRTPRSAPRLPQSSPLLLPVACKRSTRRPELASPLLLPHACKRTPRRQSSPVLLPTHASAHRGAHMLTTAPPALPKIRVNISIETATEATIEAAAVTAAEAFAHGEKPSTGCLGFIPQGAVPGDQFLHIAICNQNRAGVAPLTPTQVRDWSVIASD